jgi:hypothetical protein
MPRRMGLVEHIACMREMRDSCKTLVGKPERVEPIWENYSISRCIRCKII